MANKLSSVKCFLFDLDGTMYVGGKIIDGAKEILAKISEKGGKFCYLTNNSSRSTQDYALKLKNLGLNAEIENILSSGYVAKKYIKDNFPGKKVFLLGTQSYRKELIDEGINIVDSDPDIVLISYDTELTYEKITKACLYISNGAYYMATHPDINCPSEIGDLPDAGSFMALIELSTKKKCQLICGKPFEPMAKAVMDKFSLQPHQIAMVGDRLSTDMKFAIDNDLVSILVLSGETDLKMLKESKIQTDFVFNSVKDMVNYI